MASWNASVWRVLRTIRLGMVCPDWRAEGSEGSVRQSVTLTAVLRLRRCQLATIPCQVVGDPGGRGETIRRATRAVGTCGVIQVAWLAVSPQQPRELSIALVADERFGRATDWIEAS
jgi:hypothetical protein